MDGFFFPSYFSNNRRGVVRTTERRTFDAHVLQLVRGTVGGEVVSRAIQKKKNSKTVIDGVVLYRGIAETSVWPRSPLPKQKDNAKRRVRTKTGFSFAVRVKVSV